MIRFNSYFSVSTIHNFNLTAPPEIFEEDDSTIHVCADSIHSYENNWLAFSLRIGSNVTGQLLLSSFGDHLILIDRSENKVCFIPMDFRDMSSFQDFLEDMADTFENDTEDAFILSSAASFLADTYLSHSL